MILIIDPRRLKLSIDRSVVKKLVAFLLFFLIILSIELSLQLIAGFDLTRLSFDALSLSAFVRVCIIGSILNELAFRAWLIPSKNRFLASIISACGYLIYKNHNELTNSIMLFLLISLLAYIIIDNIEEDRLKKYINDRYFLFFLASIVINVSYILLNVVVDKNFYLILLIVTLLITITLTYARVILGVGYSFILHLVINLFSFISFT